MPTIINTFSTSCKKIIFFFKFNKIMIYLFIFLFFIIYYLAKGKLTKEKYYIAK